VGRYLPVVHAFAYAHVGNHADAEDAAQEAFLRAFQSLDTLRDRAKFGPWVVGIARHTCSGVRNSRRRQARLAEEVRRAPTSISPDVVGRDLRELVRRKVAELDEPSREVLLLYYFSGKKIHEVADLLGITPDAAAKRIQRAREELGDRLLSEMRPAFEPERSEQERKAGVMGLVMGMPAAWAPATTPGSVSAPRPAVSTLPTGSAGVAGSWVAKNWPTVFLVLAAVLLGVVVAGVWIAFERGTSPRPAGTVQPTYTPGAGGKIPYSPPASPGKGDHSKPAEGGKGAAPVPSKAPAKEVSKGKG
jgi:RNA polymerase sigma factor (sigma-70 family)